VSVNFGTELQRFPRGVQARRACVQHRPAVTQACNALPIQQVGIDSGNLGGGVSTHTHGVPAELINKLEGLELERLTSSRQQRVEVFKQRGHDKLETIAARHVQQAPAKFFDVPCLRWKHIGDVLRQQPRRQACGGHSNKPLS
jgi:hypothetical protein